MSIKHNAMKKQVTFSTIVKAAIKSMKRRLNPQKFITSALNSAQLAVKKSGCKTTLAMYV